MKYLLILFTVLFFSCIKENIEPEMKQSEKILLNELLNSKSKQTGKVNISIETNFYKAISSNITHDFVYSNLTGFSFVTNSLENIDVYLLGFNDYLNNFNVVRNLCPSIKQSVNNYAFGGGFILRPNDWKIFCLKDDLTPFVNLPYSDALNPNITKNLFFQSFVNGNYKRGDFVMINFLDNEIVNKSNFPFNVEYLWSETIYRCESIPYISFCEFMQNNEITITGIQHDFTYYIPYSIPLPERQNEIPQINLPISFLKYNIFGQTSKDTFNEASIIPPSNYNITVIKIPIKIKSKDLVIHFPIVPDRPKQYFTFHLTIN